MLETVLRATQVAHLYSRRSRLECLPLAFPERVDCSDLSGFVGVHDAPVTCPDLYPHDALVENVFLHDSIEPFDACLVSYEHSVTEGRLDDALPCDSRELSRLANRLGAPELRSAPAFPSVAPAHVVAREDLTDGCDWPWSANDKYHHEGI